MKKKLTFLTISLFLFANVCYPQTTVTFKLSSNDNEALIWSHPLYANTPAPDDPSYQAGAWTWNGTFGIIRGLMEFNLSSIPSNATVVSARLNLYNNPTSSFNGGLHSSLSGSNASTLQRITAAWNENTVTWNNQPATTNVNQALLAQSSTVHQDYLNIDVTSMVNDMVQNPGSSFGFMIQLQTEINYRCLIFASGANADTTKRPVLVVTYTTSSVNPTCIDIRLDSTLTYGQSSIVWSHPSGINTPDPHDPSFEAAAWTWNGTFGIMRSLMEFNLGSVPSNATIISSSLDLYNNPASSLNGGQHSSLSGSNASVLRRVTDPWNEGTVTWNNQPNVTTMNEVSLAQSSSAHQDYLNVNVTSMVADMIQNPATSHGFRIELQTEVQYRCMIFASGGNPDTAKYPILHICYTVPDHPTAGFQSSGTTFCSETSTCVNFFDHSTGNPTGWLWLFPGSDSASSSLQNPTGICYSTPGTYAVTLITTNANGSDTLTISPMITLASPPLPPTITLTGSDTLNSSPASSYQWYFNGAPVFGATNSWFPATSAGTYAVLITDSLGCSSISNGFMWTEVHEVSGQNSFEIYPNPATSNLIIHFPAPLKSNTTLLLTNVFGQLVSKVVSVKGELNQEEYINDLPAGVYFVILQNEEGQVVRKFVKSNP